MRYCFHELQAGVTGYKRSESLNDDPIFAEAMADIVKNHLESGKVTTPLMSLRCPSCNSDYCADQKEFFANQKI
jgi:ferrochelatase